MLILSMQCLSFEASIYDYWQAQPGFNLTRAALNSKQQQFKVSTAFHAGADHSANNNPAAEMSSPTFPFSATAVWE